MPNGGSLRSHEKCMYHTLPGCGNSCLQLSHQSEAKNTTVTTKESSCVIYKITSLKIIFNTSFVLLVLFGKCFNVCYLK